MTDLDRGIALLAALLVAVSAASAIAGGRQESVNDERSDGSLYDDPSIYAACDIDTLTAQRQTRFVQAKVTLRGKSDAYRVGLNLNTSGSGRSEPEYYTTGESLIKTGGVNDFGSPEDPQPKGEIKVALKAGGEQVVLKVPIRKLGRPRSTGVQAKTCGEGAVDIAPGKDYFDDTGFSGRVAYRYLEVKTG